jgi:orotidine-5'-phosphate decarboxylase
MLREHDLSYNEKQVKRVSSDFVAKLEQLWHNDNFVCVGLDPDYFSLPDRFRRLASKTDALLSFNRDIIDSTHDLVCAYKTNIAFYEALGSNGWNVLSKTVTYIKSKYPEIPIILDAKRADIGTTNRGYVQAAFDELGVDAITVHPYLGKEAMEPFLARKDKGIIVLVRTSNPGAGEFQDLSVGERQEPLYRVVARNVALDWNENGNCSVVVGATYPRELAEVRAIIGDMPILIPGIGAQGGEVASTVNAGKDSRGWGMIINSSRVIIFASRQEDYQEAARIATVRLKAEVNRFR